MSADVDRGMWAGADLTPPDEGVAPTPAQWIGLFVALPAEGRLEWAGRVLQNAEVAHDCFVFGHQSLIDAMHREAAARCFWSYGCTFRANHHGDCRTRDGRPAEPVSSPVDPA